MTLLLIIIIFIICFLLITKRNYTENFLQKKNNLHKYFDSIYVITLPKRKEYIKNVMNSLSIKPIYFKAIDKDKLNFTELSNKNIIKKNYRVRGAIACQQSHLSVLKKFLKSSSKTCLILEDDLKKSDLNLDEFNSSVDNLMKDLPKTFDILYLGRCFDNCKIQKKISNNLVQNFHPKCTHAYGVTRKAAEIIIKNLEYNMSMPIDWNYATLIKEKKMKSYASYPAIFHQNRKELGSTIGSNSSLPECSRKFK